jgi:hypothetical protein
MAETTHDYDQSPELWKMFFTEIWATRGGQWRSLPRCVSHSPEFLKLSDQAARLMIYLWDLIWLDKDNKELVNDGTVSFSKNRMMAIGVLKENIDRVKLEIVNAGFFTEIAPYCFRLNDQWKN